MSLLVYLPEFEKRRFVDRIVNFVELYKTKVEVQFINIDEQVEKSTKEYYEEIGSTFHPDIHDEADFAERALHFSIGYYEDLQLMKYNAYMMALATLYQIWEQQFRSMLYQQLTWDEVPLNDNGKPIEFKDFATDINAFKELFSYATWTFTDLDKWNDINELRIVQNVIKHGEGVAAKQLRKLQPEFLKVEDESSLNQIILLIPDQEIDRYRDALVSFWKDMPTRVEFEFPSYIPRIEGPLQCVEDTVNKEWRHQVSGYSPTVGMKVKVKFGKKNWIEGIYHWSGNKDDLAQLKSTASSEILYIGLNHRVQVIQ